MLPVLFSLNLLSASDARQKTVRELAGQVAVAPYFGENPAAGTAQDRDYVSLVTKARVDGLILLNRMQRLAPRLRHAMV